MLGHRLTHSLQTQAATRIDVNPDSARVSILIACHLPLASTCGQICYVDVLISVARYSSVCLERSQYLTSTVAYYCMSNCLERNAVMPPSAPNSQVQHASISKTAHSLDIEAPVHFSAQIWSPEQGAHLIGFQCFHPVVRRIRIVATEIAQIWPNVVLASGGEAVVVGSGYHSSVGTVELVRSFLLNSPSGCVVFGRLLV